MTRVNMKEKIHHIHGIVQTNLMTKCAKTRLMHFAKHINFTLNIINLWYVEIFFFPPIFYEPPRTFIQEVSVPSRTITFFSLQICFHLTCCVLLLHLCHFSQSLFLFLDSPSFSVTFSVRFRSGPEEEHVLGWHRPFHNVYHTKTQVPYSLASQCWWVMFQWYLLCPISDAT